MSRPKFVNLKQIASALEVAERTVRRKAEQLGLDQARDKTFRNRYNARQVERALCHRGYEVTF